MNSEDLDFNGLITQMWGSEESLQSFLDSEMPELCARVCGPDAEIPRVQITYPSLKVVEQQQPPEGSGEVTHYKVESDALGYRAGRKDVPAKLFVSILHAGHKEKLREFLAYLLIFHWEALGAEGADEVDYTHSFDAIIRESSSNMSDATSKDVRSPQFLAKAAIVAREFEVPLGEFLAPKVSLNVYR